MGTTLQNGVYLPSEGERNCYAGLKTNWEILDQKVADVTALQQAVAGALHREIVESLPTTDIDPNTIYMILSGTSATENVYNEFMYVNNAWELIGTSATDLTNYYTKAEVDGKLLLKASASDLTSHTGDTTIHVTTADKNKWNNQTYVFRYSSTALVASSTNSNTLLDNTDNLKVGDKVIDSNGVLFSITAIDTENSTFTIGTALIDLAQDSDVVHKSGNETVSGQKTFTNDIVVSKNASNMAIFLQNLSYDPKTNGQSGIEGKSCGINFLTSTGDPYININAYGLGDRTLLRFTNSYFTDSQNIDYDSVEFSIYGNGARSFRPRNTSNCDLGESNKQWKGVYATNYYYGSNNVEFSTKFVTTDTTQTISGAKTFLDVPITLKSSTAELGVTGGNTNITFLDKNGKNLSGLTLGNYGSSKLSYARLNIFDKDTNNNEIQDTLEYAYVSNNANAYLRVNRDNFCTLGSASYRWKGIYAQSYYYGSNSVEFSTKFVTTDTNQTISGNKTFSSINGVEPSSLSLPSGTPTEQIDISSYFSNTGSGDTNSYTALANGWIYLRLGDITSCQVVLNDSSDRRLWGTSATGNVEQIIIPVLKDTTLTTTWVTNSTVNVATARFIPCQGNV